MPQKEGRAKRSYAFHNDIVTLNRQFYEEYDEVFLRHKAETLMVIDSQRDAFTRLIADAEHREVTLDENYFAALRAEVRFTEVHQMESLFSLLFAPYQDLPHRVFLAEYRVEQLRGMVERLAQRKIGEATAGHYTTERQFVQASVYSGFSFADPEKDEAVEQWNSHLDDLAWLLRHIADRFLDSPEYNAYKHGLRIQAEGHAWIKIGVPGGAGPGITRMSRDSVRYITSERDEENRRCFRETTKLFSAVECLTLIRLMHAILACIKASRLAEIRGDEHPELIPIPSFDRQEIINLGMNNSSISTLL